MLKLQLPDYTAAQKAADALAPHIEDAWSRFAKQGHTWMSLTAWVHRDVVTLLTSDPSIVGEKELTLPPVHEQYWLCTPDALEHCLRRMLPTWFEICRTPMSDFPFEYRITYTGPKLNPTQDPDSAPLTSDSAEE